MIIVSNFYKKYKYHLLAWVLFIGYEVGITGFFLGYFSSPSNYILHYSLNILTFYFHAHVILGYISSLKGRLIQLVIPFVILIEITLYVVVAFYLEQFFTVVLHINVLGNNKLDATHISKSIWRSLYFIGISTGYYFVLRTQHRKLQYEELKQEELQRIIHQKEMANQLMIMQNAYLKAQINPHFLINTLSYIYNETRKLAPKASDAILSLSEIMQYSLSTENPNGTAILGNEIKLIENFVYLNQQKQVDGINLVISYDEDCQSILFVPLILMTLIENMLKHGVLDSPKVQAILDIRCKEGSLIIQTKNLQLTNSRLPSHGIGLKNIKERLILFYGDNATFDYQLDSQNLFSTRIEVGIESVRHNHL